MKTLAAAVSAVDGPWRWAPWVPGDAAHARVLGGLVYGEDDEWLRARLDLRAGVFVPDVLEDRVAVCCVPGCGAHSQDELRLCTPHGREGGHLVDAGQRRAWAASIGAPRSAEEFVRAAAPGRCEFEHHDGHRCLRDARCMSLCTTHYVAKRSRTPAAWARYPRSATKLEPLPGCSVRHCTRTSVARFRGVLLCSSHASNLRTSGAAPTVAWLRDQPPAGLPLAAMVWLRELPDDVAIEALLWCVDARRRRSLELRRLNLILAAARQHRVVSLLALKPEHLPAGSQAQLDLRRIQARLQVALADPEAEWDRDHVRIAIVAPGLGGTLDLRVAQPWLRRALVSWIRWRFSQIPTADRKRIGTSWLYSTVRAVREFSGHLATQPGGGRDPASLTANTIGRVAEGMAAQLGTSTAAVHLASVRPFLKDVHTHDLAPRLRASFVVQRHHIDRTTVVSRIDVETALPDATFSFLCGYDGLLGDRVFDLLGALPRADLQRDPFVTAQLQAVIRLAANFGRRKTELLQLTCDRLAVGDRGEAVLHYDNFKSGRHRVLLPIDQRSATQAQAWVDRVRGRWPQTPTAELRLFPHLTHSKGGRVPLSGDLLGVLFRDWTRFLDQAIVLAKLHLVTGIDPQRLVETTTEHVTDDGLQVDGTLHRLPTEAVVALTDYRADWSSIASSGWLFPAGRAAQQRDSRKSRPSLVLFNTLGRGWLDVAARYPSFGMPGSDFGRRRAALRSVQFRRFRHTYLQHLVDAGTDVFLVQELADHSDVQTTIDSYVRPRISQLKAAVDQLSRYRRDRFGAPRDGDVVRLPSTHDVLTNSCSNPQVIDAYKTGCPNGRMCQTCDWLSVDPSHRDEIRAEVLSLRKAVQHFEDADEHERARFAREDLYAWQSVLRQIDALLHDLSPEERQTVENAITVVRAMRNNLRNGPISYTNSGTLPR